MSTSSQILQLRAARHAERENKRHNVELKKLRLEQKQEYDKAVKVHEDTITRLKDNYESQVDIIDGELDQKLTEVRARQKDLIRAENERLDEEVEGLKRAHEDQVNEIRASHENQISEMNESHEKTLESARQKYMKEKLKWEA